MILLALPLRKGEVRSRDTKMIPLNVPYSALKGRALFSLIFFTSPGLLAAVNSADTTKKTADETMTVVANGSRQSATNGYQPVNTSTATLTSMPMLDIPQVVNTVSEQVLQDQHATNLDEALYNVSYVLIFF